MVLMKTWVEEKRWRKTREKLPKGYEWKVQMAKKRNKKGRAIGDMIIGTKEEGNSRSKRTRKKRNEKDNNRKN